MVSNRRRGRVTGSSFGRRLALFRHAVAAKIRRGDLPAYGLLIGLLLGFGTDTIVTAAGV